ncbi:hypothetical protein ASPSYDRAFT_473829 [Aspergillus sydowii CBS 593.65]|uniref:Uncharacterized protein n=1 Tax=Aspergillus sydowii CBS 593.65 TaxID=1036612 RepID=A0A1L9T5I6_9EURO|nr:uncharacterized protein ASPSYDRAFT_473829 [Aspergillus sydowii CBS 593.65]OJJ54704.1 hypothetical protein ASPSYDRAFT_473829 [Aspergillus sydowii CBS 593.65]
MGTVAVSGFTQGYIEARCFHLTTINYFLKDNLPPWKSIITSSVCRAATVCTCLWKVVILLRHGFTSVCDMIVCLFHIISAIAHLLRVSFLLQKPNCRSIKAKYTGLAIARLAPLCQLIQIHERFYNDANYPRPMASSSVRPSCCRVRRSMADSCRYQPAASSQVLVKINGVQSTRARTGTLNPFFELPCI